MTRRRTGSIQTTPLMIGVGVCAALTAAFILLAGSVLREKTPGDFDLRWAYRLKQAADAHPDNTRWINAVTYLGNRYALAALAAAGALWQFWRGRHWLAIAWVVIAAGGYGLNEAVKVLAARDRPPLLLRDPHVTEHLSSYSFPSGHAMGSLIGFGLFGYGMVLGAKRRMGAILAIVDTVVIVFAIGFSRMYLRVHWATDVIGGFLLGGAWLGLCLGVLEAWRRGHETPPTPAATAAPKPSVPSV